MQELGFFCSVLIGFCLGLMGGGGSMLTIPVLVYLLGIDPILSTAYSLFVVGTTALIGTVNYIHEQIHYRIALLFSIPSSGVVFVIRRYVIPTIPDPIFVHESFRLSKALAFLLFFAFIMLVASFSMIKGERSQENNGAVLPQYRDSLTILTGILAGSLTGLAGIGGGFLIIPALVILMRLPMKKAVGTSLLIIAVNSFTGFLSDTTMERFNWPFLLVFTSLAVLGILVGSYVSRFVSGLRTRMLFGWSVLGLSVYIIGKEALIPMVKTVQWLCHIH
ncbi:sulfite exporter TauE/SafE family protein [Spirosoma endbachense]|uniref:Probable membrane transporter protein n=1 Tax=Spirosoma endbachense TaxID=2666025 RepID=A0A6P1VVX8_9BACT|nr:sulfite exporter TauE/SafE family protein [Spirosoma endbachense]QHV97371.1 TSUP family transporter [Spirosoma endbachense]